MARPETPGCRYFPLDCDFYNDRKLRLLTAEFGGKAEAVILRLWCMIYADKGYYLPLSEDDVLLLADSMGRGFTDGYIREVIAGACKRGLFDEAVFANFHVLTSAGIQRRYLEVKAKKRIIPVIKEYWVLPEACEAAGERDPFLKLQFFSISGEKTAVFEEKTQVSEEKNTQKKKKEKQTKAKQNTPARDADIAAQFAAFAGDNAALAAALQAFLQHRAAGKHPLTELAAQRVCRKLDALADAARVQDRSGYQAAILDQSVERGWEGLFAVEDWTDTPQVHHSTRTAASRKIGANADITDFF